MKFFIDTAIIEEIKQAQEWGLVDGVTTNPSLVAKSGKKFFEVVKEILALVPGPVSIEAVSKEAEGIIREAKEISKMAKNAVVKITMTEEGLKAVRFLKPKGIKTNVTLVFSPNQALLAARAGASYVSPFVGRLDDIGQDGMQVVEETLKIFSNYKFKTQIIVASVRNVDHVRRAAMMGAPIATVPFQILQELFKHDLTAKGITKFLEDWEKVPK